MCLLLLFAPLIMPFSVYACITILEAIGGYLSYINSAQGAELAAGVLAPIAAAGLIFCIASLQADRQREARRLEQEKTRRAVFDYVCQNTQESTLALCERSRGDAKALKEALTALVKEGKLEPDFAGVLYSGYTNPPEAHEASPSLRKVKRRRSEEIRRNRADAQTEAFAMGWSDEAVKRIMQIIQSGSVPDGGVQQAYGEQGERRGEAKRARDVAQIVRESQSESEVMARIESLNAMDALDALEEEMGSPLAGSDAPYAREAEIEALFDRRIRVIKEAQRLGMCEKDQDRIVLYMRGPDAPDARERLETMEQTFIDCATLEEVLVRLKALETMEKIGRKESPMKLGPDLIAYDYWLTQPLQLLSCQNPENSEEAAAFEAAKKENGALLDFYRLIAEEEAKAREEEWTEKMERAYKGYVHVKSSVQETIGDVLEALGLDAGQDEQEQAEQTARAAAIEKELTDSLEGQRGEEARGENQSMPAQR